MSVYESAEWRALVAAVVAAPDDDLPRLVAADFLEERGEGDRAAFVRIQVEFAHTLCHQPVMDDEETSPRTPWSVYCDDSECRHCELGRRGRAIHPGDRLYPPGARDDYDYLTCEFRRGFVESVSCPAAAWLAHGDDVLKQHPVRRVRLTTLENEVPGWRAMRYISSAGQMHWLTDRWPGIEFELPPPDEPEVISVRGVPVVMRPDLGGPVIDWSGMRLGPPVAPARVRIEGYLDPETGLPVVPGDD